MPAWATLAWMNRERLLAAARKLQWPLRTWATLIALAGLGAGVYWVVTRGHVIWTTPHAWPLAQWVLLVVNVVGFTGLYLLTRTWFRAQDELREEVDMLRSQVDDLRVAVHEHEHDIVTVEDDDERPLAKVLPVVNKITTNELPVVEPATQVFQAVRSAPTGDREPAVVERVLGGRTFRFRGEETSELG